ncbi:MULTISPECIES: hypothetical protein [Spirulina sp. CCY15215]|uniref:hypothetical protein n=1 Tax=Spirulina sp. CCY15215 TaxID=2767591 RepID=UPI00194DDF0A|nr:hypothetical protein [Spirulina major]
MLQTIKTSQLQQAIEMVEKLSIEEQAVLVELVQHRIKQKKRETLVQEVREAEKEYECGQVYRGSIAELMAELDH